MSMTARTTRATVSVVAAVACLMVVLGSAPIANAQSAVPPDAAASSTPDRTQVPRSTDGPTVPAVSASPSPRLTGTDGLFDAPTQVFVDHFDDETAWFTGDRDTDRFAYEGRRLRRRGQERRERQLGLAGTRRQPPRPSRRGVRRAVGRRGAGGYMCGAGDADQRGFIFGDVTSSAEWVMGTITGSTATVRARGPVAERFGCRWGPGRGDPRVRDDRRWRSRRDVGRWRDGGAGPAVRRHRTVRQGGGIRRRHDGPLLGVVRRPFGICRRCPSTARR